MAIMTDVSTAGTISTTGSRFSNCEQDHPDRERAAMKAKV
jgi:hypothetical protein